LREVVVAVEVEALDELEGTASVVLAGEPGSLERSFGTCCHGAGRGMSRTGARRRIGGAELRRQLEEQGIVVRCPSN
jgi:tRNA-splicing ligase RtcB